jgi:hypothetical protein
VFHEEEWCEMAKWVDAGEFVEYVKNRGYTCEPLTNSGACAQEDAALKIMGYRLVGPRRNTTIVPKGPNDQLDLEQASLWCDGVDYSTKKIKERQQSKRAV